MSKESALVIDADWPKSPMRTEDLLATAVVLHQEADRLERMAKEKPPKPTREEIDLLTIPQFLEEAPAFRSRGKDPEMKIRMLIHREELNGLKRSRAIVRIGRSVYIKRGRFMRWVEGQAGR